MGPPINQILDPPLQNISQINCTRKLYSNIPPLHYKNTNLPPNTHNSAHCHLIPVYRKYLAWKLLHMCSDYVSRGQFPWHTLATDIFYWKRMDFLIVTDVFSKYFLVRKLANSSSAAVCAEIATIVTELGLPHIIRSDNGPCYNSKEFQQLLQCYNITHHTSSPHHPRSNGFVERMVGVAKKLMDKAGSEGKLDFRSV